MQGEAEAGKRRMQGWYVRDVSSCAAGQKPWRKKNEGSAVSAGHVRPGSLTVLECRINKTTHHLDEIYLDEGGSPALIRRKNG
jgi:hypothetical protein